MGRMGEAEKEELNPIFLSFFFFSEEVVRCVSRLTDEKKKVD